MDPKRLHERKKNRLEDYNYSSCGVYFITICTLGRRNLFWNQTELTSDLIQSPQNVNLSQYGQIVDDAINSISSAYPTVYVDTYVIMPNHIHVLLQICGSENKLQTDSPTISQIVKQLKRYVSKSIGISIWQKSFFDHIVRNRTDYEEHCRYIYENPINWLSDELYIGGIIYIY